ncbi:MAG: radical SAM protein [Candidatus Schekmanbacteria bacterium]|nr:MAG: radical SAM protein [Candidatus Schekmanbacteria bacterium]
MKVLFISKGQETLAIEYLSSALKKEGHKVELLFDPGLDDNMGFWDVSILRKINPDNVFKKEIARFSPDLVALSCPLNMFPFVRKAAALVKSVGQIPVIVGGGHPTIAPDYVLSDKNVDIVCLGEGEEPLVELAERIESGKSYDDVKNLWIKKENGIVKNPIRPLLEDLDSLPFPDREIFYRYNCFSGNLYFIAGRGCPFNCTYCCQHSFQNIYRGLGKYVRLRSVDNVIEELIEAVKKYPAEHIHSEDDTFAFDHNWTKDFCREYKKHIGIPFYCHVRPGTLTEEILNDLADAGCVGVFFGVDCGNEEMRTTVLKRKIPNDVIIEQAKLVKKSGIKLSCSSMFCLPGETPEQMYETFNMIKEIDSDYAYATIYYPFYGTELFDYAYENGYLDEETVALIKDGGGSLYGEPLIKSKYKDTALLLKNVLPAYMRFKKLRSIFDYILKMKSCTAGKIVNLFLTPFSYGTLGKLKRREMLRVFFRFLSYWLRLTPIKKIAGGKD